MLDWIHVLEEWLLQYGAWGLFIVSFLESSFFPIPPDVLMIPMGIANPDKAFWYAFITTAGSVLGALLGWYIGRKVGRPILRYFIKEEKIVLVERYFEKYGAMAIVIAGFTPIPYKVFTIFSGITRVAIPTLLIWSTIGRGARFFLEAVIIVALGEKAMPFIEQNFAILTAAVGGALLIGYLIYMYLRKSDRA